MSGRFQSMVSTWGGRDWMQRAHDCNGQERPLVGGSATDRGQSSASGMTNSFHVSIKRSREGMGRGNGRPATNSPRSWETKGSRKLWEPLKRVSVILSSRRVSREKGITRGTQGKKEVGSRVSGSPSP